MGRWFDTSKPGKQKDTDKDKPESIDAKRAVSKMWNQDEKEVGNAFIGIV